MEIGAILAASVAVFVALLALAKANSFAKKLEDVDLGSQRRIKNLAAELEASLATQRELLAQVASGAGLTREMILEGRLWHDIDGLRAKELVNSGARVLDVRTPAETARGIIPGALLIPVDTLEERMHELPKDQRAWLVYCAAGGRSAAACEFLSRAGYASLHNLNGGIGAWSGALARPN